MPDGSLTCDHCGAYLGKGRGSRESGVQAMRQGRMNAQATPVQGREGGRAVYGDYDAAPVDAQPQARASRPKPVASGSRPNTRRGVPVNAHGRVPTLKSHRPGAGGYRRRGINWALVTLVAAVLAVMGAVGYVLYLRNSDEGQRATARRMAASATEGMFALALTEDPLLIQQRDELLEQWGAVPAQAYWYVGEEALDAGDMAAAILAMRVADVLDPDNYDGLLLLANAYELNADSDEAESVYLRLSQDVNPARSEAYTALISLYQQQDRGPEAADMMLLAYENTGRESFKLQREDFIPLSPQTSLTAGRYDISELEDDVYFSSPQGYDVYYTLDDDAVLPQDGILTLDGSIHPEEGTVTLRAVCVSGDLVSDPISVTYVFYYPSPPAPNCNLAPNTYSSTHTVSLRPGQLSDDLTNKEKEEMISHFKYYYTIDGSPPSEESPEFDGTPIALPTRGYVTLRAICVNQYGKKSSTLEVTYKFTHGPLMPGMYASTDVFSGFELNKTTMESFTSAFGQPKEQLETTYLTMEGQARHLTYDWGYAVFVLTDGKWQLTRIDMTSSIAQGPRGVGFGSTLEEITAAYKDFGQVQSPDGSRGLYYDLPNVGRVEKPQDDGKRTVSYTCQAPDGHKWVLNYHLSASGRVERIEHYYQP